MKRIVLLIAVLALVATACGGAAGADDGVASLDDTTALDSPASSVAAAEPTREEALLAFTACLRDQGVDVNDPTVDAAGNLRLERPNNAQGDADFDRDAFRAAREACVEHLEGVTLGFRDEDSTEIEDQLLEFAECVRENGYDMPDPDFSALGAGGGPGGGPFGQLDREDPAFQAAAEACSDILSGFPGRGAGGGPGAGN